VKVRKIKHQKVDKVVEGETTAKEKKDRYQQGGGQEGLSEKRRGGRAPKITERRKKRWVNFSEPELPLLC